MARRNDHSKEELMAMAIAAGQEIIATEGFAHFSARKVARRIGYTIGTIYHLFGSHDALILHINAQTLDDLTHSLTERRDATLTGQAHIQHLAACYVDFATSNYARWNILFEHRLPEGEALPAWYAQKITALFTLVEEPLLTLTRNQHTATYAARTLWAAIHGICTLGLSGKLDVVGADTVHQLVKSLVDNYLKGLTT